VRAVMGGNMDLLIEKEADWKFAGREGAKSER
jgi:hypothetical protein